MFYCLVRSTYRVSVGETAVRALFHTVTGTENDRQRRRKTDRRDVRETDTCNTNVHGGLTRCTFSLTRTPFTHDACTNKNNPVTNGQRILYVRGNTSNNKHHVCNMQYACIIVYNKYTLAIYGRPAGGEREPRPRARSFKVKLTN